jgi:hypothetical protein
MNSPAALPLRGMPRMRTLPNRCRMCVWCSVVLTIQPPGNRDSRLSRQISLGECQWPSLSAYHSVRVAHLAGTTVTPTTLGRKFSLAYYISSVHDSSIITDLPEALLPDELPRRDLNVSTMTNDNDLRSKDPEKRKYERDQVI